MNIYEYLKKIDPEKLEIYLDKNIYLTYEQGIELTSYYVRKLITRIPADKELKRRWLVLNEKYKNAFLDNKRIHLFRTCTGSGKTVTSILWVKYLTQLSKNIEGFVVLSAEYEHGTDEIERIILKHGNKINMIRFEGKNRICHMLKKPVNESGITIEMLMKSGISIKTFCEDECEVRDSCLYMCNCATVIAPIEKGGIKNWIGVQHQLNNFFPIYLYHVGEIILIIDEDFTDAIKSHFRLGVPLLRKNKEFLELVLKIMNGKTKEKDNDYIDLIESYIILIDLFLNGIYHIGSELNYNAIFDVFDNIDSCDPFGDYLERLSDFAYYMIKEGKLVPFDFIFDKLHNLVDNFTLEQTYDIEIEEGHLDKWARSAFYKKQDKMEITFLYYDKYVLIKLFGRDNLTKLIINDATADKVILKYIIGDQEPIIEHNEDWMYDKCEFRQLKKKLTFTYNTNKEYAHYPKSSFYHIKTFTFLMKDVLAIVERHYDQKILIVARQIKSEKIPFAGGLNLSEYLISYCSGFGFNNISFEDYPLSSTNEYSDHNIVILLGRPELPNTVTWRQSNLINIDQQLYRDLYSRNQMHQAMGRIMRGGEKKYVYILSGFDLLIKKEIIPYKSHSHLQETLHYETTKIRNEIEMEKQISKIKNYIKLHKFITINQCSDLLKITYYKCDRLLKSLVNNNFLRFKLGNRGTKNFYF